MSESRRLKYRSWHETKVTRSARPVIRCDANDEFGLGTPHCEMLQVS